MSRKKEDVLSRFKISYIVLQKEHIDELLENIIEQPGIIKNIFENINFIIYKVNDT